MKNKKNTVLIVGFSTRSGVGAAKLLHKLGVTIAIWDSKTKKDLQPSFDKTKNIPFVFFSEQDGIKIQTILKNVETIILSPGVPQSIQLIKKAKQYKIPVISEIELAYFYNPFNWIAITGTDGKTTTTTLVAQIFKDAGYKIALGGNIGKSISSELLKIKNPDFIIVELSSFQLETIHRMQPKISAILNITPDHLNRYKNFQEYQMTKTRIYMNQKKNEFLIINKNSLSLMDAIKKNKPKAQKIYCSRISKIKNGAFIDNDIIYFAQKNKITKILNTKKIALQGEHNRENILVAVSIALLSGVPLSNLRKTLMQFKGLPHRTEVIGFYNERMFINDSKATTLHSVEMALMSMTVPVILLMGGRAKDHNFKDLTPIIKKKTKMLITFGESGKMIYEQINVKHKIQEKTFKEAVNLSFQLSEKGDTILLSPGCTSFDEFLNFEARGKMFKQIVQKWTKKK